MQEVADFDVNDFAQSAVQADDDKLLVRFFSHPLQDTLESTLKGRPVFRDCIFVDIKIAGSRDGGVVRPATHNDKQRFHRHFAAFNQRVEAPIAGTPLTEWSGVTASQIAEFAHFNIKTVENLVNMSDGNASQFMGINILRQKAKAYLSNATKSVDTAQFDEALKERDDTITEQTTLIENMGDQLKAMEMRVNALSEDKPTELVAASSAETASPPKLATDAPRTRRRRPPKKAG
jgi:hypothetical protein